MTPSPPDEALHFRGKTLTPESPRPLHIPEPSNIPVLENQMDPVFNDTSTYERSVYKQAPQTHDGWLHGGSKDGQGGPSQTQGAGSFHGSQPNRGVQNEMIASAYYSPPNPASGSENTGHLGSGLSPPDSTYSHTAPVAPVSQGFATGSEVDPAHKPEQSRMSDRLIAEERVGHKAGGVNFQQLLDNLSRPNPGATIPVTSSAGHSSLHQAPAGESLKSQGIPAHPQAQSHDSVQAHYMPNGEVAYHQLPSAHDAAATASPAYSAQPSNTQAQTQPQPIDTSSSGGASVNLPPPIATFPQPPSTCAEPHGSLQEPSVASKKGRAEKRSIKPADDDSPWGPEIQKKYDEFLHDERIYVTEGLWDRFPVGSRLFVGQYCFRLCLLFVDLTFSSCAGNLPTERVTKRDMFHIFHDYGKLAQISIKQAYGFIQFLEASSCHEALSNEQGAVVRGRKIRELLEP